MTASWSGPYVGSTEYKRGSRASLVANGRLPSDRRWQTTHHVQLAAALAMVKDKPSAALKKRRP
jgi:hypothetical protein